MSSPLDRPIKIEVTLRSSQPELLEGLDVWLRLGLISEAQVRQICKNTLTCQLPQPAVATLPTPQIFEIPISDFELEPIAENPKSAFPERSQNHAMFREESISPKIASKSGVGMLQSLMAELSVRWLLFLGVFMVVVSSGVLAASQWERFPAVGQYGVLLAYTLIFWAVSFWADKQPNLRLTAKTLQIVTLLLVPVNFWAIDSFGLWQNPLNWIAVAIATIALSSIAFLLLKNHTPASPQQLQALPVFNILGLSYLHWGWRLSAFPLIAVYLAMVGTSAIAFYQTRYRQQSVAAVPEDRTEEDSHPIAPSSPLNLPAAVTIYALVVLLFRAIFVARVDITQLGLALGICGWLVAWLGQQGSVGAKDTPIPNSPGRGEWPFAPTGISILLGWLVSVGTTFPWQATAVSGLGLWFFTSRLHRFWRRVDLTAIFAIGLQTNWLIWRLVPQSVQAQAIATLTKLADSRDVPLALLSLALFPYLILMVAIAHWLDRRSKPDLARFGEASALGFGVVLTLIGLANPTLRSLNLLFSTATLAIVTFRRPTRVGANGHSPLLVYLTHITGLLTLFSAIDRLFPNLSHPVWASILLAVMVAEWGFSLKNQIYRPPTLNPDSAKSKHPTLLWQRSAWHIGLGLAWLSYQLLWANASSYWDGDAFLHQRWGIVWLFTPLALTGVASQNAPRRRRLASWLSVAALLAAQLLVGANGHSPLPGARLIGLGVATGLMLVNTRYLRHQAAAAIAVGFSLSFAGALLWDGIPGVPRLSVAGWFVAGAIALCGLWSAMRLLMRRRGTLAALYAKAADGWAIALCGFELLVLTFHSLFVYQQSASPGWEYIITAAIIFCAIAYRTWQQPNNKAFYALGWCMELLAAEALGFVGHSVINLAIANIALGLMTQLLGEVWRRRHRTETLKNSLHILPLLYGVLGALLRWGTFTSTTGLLTGAIALIVIGIGRRRQEFKPLVYLGLIGVSVSAYEISIYQMLQASGGAIGDAFIAMSALGASIMYAYRILSPWLINYLRLTAEELKAVSHIHWAISSALLMAATQCPIASGTFVGLATGVFLSRYAIFQGRLAPLARPEETVVGGMGAAEIWVYLGLLELIGTRILWLDTQVGQLFDRALLPWNVAIACLCAYFLYILPWETWGWSKRPWQRAAYILPLVTIWETREVIPSVGLLIAAGFYVLLARLAEQIRFTYISVALIDWVLFRTFSDLRLTDALWYITPIGLSVLYVAQFDPGLKPRKGSPPLTAGRGEWPFAPTRHNLRLLGTGAICGAAFLFHQDTGLQPGIFSIIAIFAGLALRVRAFLYVGTAIFLLNAFNQLVILIFRQPFFKWIVGLIVGIAFIWIAANFETRRDRLTSLFQNWIAELQEWE